MLKDKEKSILEFQGRILDLVSLPDTPVLEKINFLEIVKSNLEEFISVRLQRIDSINEENAIIKITELFMRMGLLLEGINDQYGIEEITPSVNIYSVIKHKGFRNIYSGENDVTKILNLDQVSGVKKKPIVESVIYSDTVPKVAAIYKISCPKNVLLLNMYREKYEEAGHTERFDKHMQYTKISSYYTLLQKQDFLIRNPYEPYQHILDFIDEMCTHSKIHSIFITLYRLAKESEIINSLIKAKKMGKAVYVYVEPSARGDEESNLNNITRLLEEGVNVSTSYFKYKVHCKIFCAVDESNRKYVHIGTGNYNEDTAKIYTDCHLLTTRKNIVNDALNSILHLFKKELSPISQQNKLFVAPLQLRYMIIRMIRQETMKGDRGIILLKCNNLYDTEIISALYEAADNDVRIRIICRTACGILPKKNMVIRSKVGKYLEHDRVYIFGNHTFISSADLMTRNLSKRMEILCEIQSYKMKLISIFMSVWYSKNIHQLTSDGLWELV